MHTYTCIYVCIDAYIYLMHTFIEEHSCYFQILIIVANNAKIKLEAHMTFQVSGFIIFDKYSEVDIWYFYCWEFWEIHTVLHIVTTSKYNPVNSVQVLPSIHTLFSSCYFNESLLKSGKWSHCVICISLKWYWAHFHILMDHLCDFFEEVSI